MTQAYPPPALGLSVVARVVLTGSPHQAVFEGEVLQSSAAATIIQLSPLSDEARIALARMGLPEADPAGLLAALEANSSDTPRVPIAPPPPVTPAAWVAPAPPVAPTAPVPSVPEDGTSYRPLVQDRPKAAPSTPLSRSEGGGFEWAYHLSGKALREREADLPEPTRSGEVGEASWRDALISFFMEGLTGVVVVHGFREDRWLFLVGGRPTHYVLQKTHPGESVGDSLRESGGGSPDGWAAAHASSDSELAAAEGMVKAGLITKAELATALHQRAVVVTRSLVRANFGDWAFHPLQESGARLSWESVDVLEVLLDAERRSLASRSGEEIVRDTEAVLSHHVTIVEGREGVIAALPLAARERVVAEDLLPGGWTIKELFVYSGLDEQELLRFILVLKSLGTLVFLESEGAKTKRNRAERALYVGLREITRRGAFEAIHSHWTAIDEDIERGYRQVLEDFNRERFTAVYDERLGVLIDRIQERAGELYEQLKTKAGRDRVRKKMIGPSQLIMATDLMGKQGNMAAYKGRLDLARVCYLRVLELAVKGPECAEAVRTARAQLALDPIRNATSSAGSHLADLASAVDKFLGQGDEDS